MIVYYGDDEYRDYSIDRGPWINSLFEIPDNTEFVVLFKSPSEEELECILHFGMDKILAHEGIHLPCRKFSGRETLLQIITSYQKENSDTQKEKYIRFLSDLTDEESDYLFQKHGIRVPIEEERSNVGVRSYSGKLITYRGGGELFKQLTSYIACHNKKSKILLIDGDLIRPSLDEIFHIHRVSCICDGYMTGKDNTGLNVALELIKRKASVDETINKTTIPYTGFFRKKMKNLFRNSGGISIMLGNYNIYNYEYYNLSTLQTLITYSLQRFDIVLVKLSEELHDEFAMAMLHRSDLNVIAIGHSQSDIRYYAQVYDMLVYRQDIHKNKICVLHHSHLFNGILSHLFKSSYKGHIKKVVSAIGRL